MNLTDLQGMLAIRSGPISRDKDKTTAISGGHDRPKGSGELLLVGKSEAPGELGNVLIKRCLGVTARAATPEEARTYHVNLGKTLVVTWLDPASALARAGVEVNDMTDGGSAVSIISSIW